MFLWVITKQDIKFLIHSFVSLFLIYFVINTYLN